jgi:hypothetical protein
MELAEGQELTEEQLARIRAITRATSRQTAAIQSELASGENTYITNTLPGDVVVEVANRAALRALLSVWWNNDRQRNSRTIWAPHHFQNNNAQPVWGQMQAAATQAFNEVKSMVQGAGVEFPSTSADELWAPGSTLYYRNNDHGWLAGDFLNVRRNGTGAENIYTNFVPEALHWIDAAGVGDRKQWYISDRIGPLGAIEVLDDAVQGPLRSSYIENSTALASFFRRYKGEARSAMRERRNLNPSAVPFQDGGVALSQWGGIDALIAEAGIDEMVIPLDTRGADFIVEAISNVEMTETDGSIIDVLNRIDERINDGNGRQDVLSNFIPENDPVNEAPPSTKGQVDFVKLLSMGVLEGNE